MAGIITYLRVSTAKQGQSGLGLEAQRAACHRYGKPIREYVEIESGVKDDRAQLAEAVRMCRVYGAKLIVAKIDRLTRDLHFMTCLRRQGLQWEAADNPNASDLTINILVSVAQEERRLISERTKAALQAAKARGVVLGGDHGGRASDAARAASLATRQTKAANRAADLRPIVDEIQAAGIASLSGIARALVERRIPKARGGMTWCAADVKALLAY